MDGTTVGESGRPPPLAGCPLTRSGVVVGGKCSPSGIECEYGESPAPACNTFYRCGGAVTTGPGWSLLSSPADGGECPTVGCPGSYDDIESGSVCTKDNAACSYSSDGICLCSPSTSSLYEWACVAATAECPVPRPRVGTPCSAPGTVCDYDECSGGIALECTGGIWVEMSVACPS
jgi:hypothetical protein